LGRGGGGGGGGGQHGHTHTGSMQTIKACGLEVYPHVSAC